MAKGLRLSSMCGKLKWSIFLLLVLQRTLPSHYPYDNAYGLFPLVTPESLASGKLPGYKINTKRPASGVTHILTTKQAISHVFNHPSIYTTGYGRDLQALTGGYGCVPLSLKISRISILINVVTFWALTTKSCAFLRV